MSEGPQYTSCVDKAVWKSVLATIGAANIMVASAAIAAIVAGLVLPVAALVGLVLAIATGAQILRKVAGWLLNGKLICMQNAKRRVFSDPDPDRVCVLGTILDFEQVGEDKSGFALIDNDFAVNLLLAPPLTSLPPRILRRSGPWRRTARRETSSRTPSRRPGLRARLRRWYARTTRRSFSGPCRPVSSATTAG
jgi:hypothetical protein